MSPYSKINNALKVDISIFSINVDGFLIQANYRYNWLKSEDPLICHLEFRSKAISETGYRSYFFNPEELIGFNTPEEFIRTVAKYFIQEQQKTFKMRSDSNTNQMSLF